MNLKSATLKLLVCFFSVFWPTLPPHHEGHTPPIKLGDLDLKTIETTRLVSTSSQPASVELTTAAIQRTPEGSTSTISPFNYTGGGVDTTETENISSISSTNTDEKTTSLTPGSNATDEMKFTTSRPTSESVPSYRDNSTSAENSTEMSSPTAEHEPAHGNFTITNSPVTNHERAETRSNSGVRVPDQSSTITGNFILRDACVNIILYYMYI